ncbi:alpha/beta hydrolase family protein [Kordiimonas laminariae]|uniref:alpha/beta hydrolase family protein n=1 Tax=Kordiimonas laminariae TaxID=2917717 RepID=UPI001FF404DA|nr:alpha/beta fold hydrolase [Kordiimonas laminariae]MCK0068994.1 alpha/beta hydrolase [Kordiimonas laminariae]
MTTALFKTFAAATAILVSSLTASAQTYVQQLGYDAPDGNRITGFIYQSKDTKRDAPLAVLMHGLMGSSLYWLAEDNMMFGDDVTEMLIDRGYRVLALDARRHGARRSGDKPMALVKAARRGNSQAYQNMINNTVKDYQYLLDKMLKNFKGTEKVVVMGYSMGAQMGTLLASQDKRVTHLVTMVPPAVRNVPEVSPINFAADVKAPWLLITAENDEYSTDKQNAELIAAGSTITNKSFDSGHVLPQAYVKTIETWLNTQQ